MDPEIRCHEMKLNPKGYLWSEYEKVQVGKDQEKAQSEKKTEVGKNQTNNQVLIP